MKKLTSILLSLVLVFSFAACSNNSSDNSNTTPSTHKLRMLRKILQNLPMKIPKILIQVQKY